MQGLQQTLPHSPGLGRQYGYGRWQYVNTALTFVLATCQHPGTLFALRLFAERRMACYLRRLNPSLWGKTP